MEIELEELKRLALAASPGNWEATECGTEGCWCRVVTTDAEIEQGSVISAGGVFKNDAEFIAAANPAVVLELIRMVREGM